MHSILNQAINLLEQVSEHFSEEQYLEFVRIKKSITNHSLSNFDNFNFD